MPISGPMRAEAMGQRARGPANEELGIVEVILSGGSQRRPTTKLWLANGMLPPAAKFLLPHVWGAEGVPSMTKQVVKASV